MKEYLSKLTLTDRIFLVTLVVWMSLFFCYERTFLALYIERYMWSINFLTLTALLAAEIIRPKRNLWCLAGLAAIAFCSFAAMRANTNVIMIILFFVYVGRDTDFRISAFVSLATISALTMLIIGLSLVGFLPDPTFSDTARLRHCLGFRYPLYPAQCIFMIACLWSYLRATKVSLVEIALLFACNIVIYLATDSRLSFILTACLLFIVLIVKLFSYTKAFDATRKTFYKLKPVGIALSGCFIVCAAISVAFTAAYDPASGLMAQMDENLSGRLKYGHQGLTEYGIPWGGQFVATNGNGLMPDGTSCVPSGGYFYIDCLYVLMLVRYGFVFFVLFIGAFTAACWYAWKTKQGFLLLALVFIALHCVIDDLSFYLFFDPFLLMAGVAPYLLLKSRASKECAAALNEADLS